MIITNEGLLRIKSRETTVKECDSQSIFLYLEKELENSNGLGLSAIQIGIPICVCIIKTHTGKIIKMINPKIEKQYEPLLMEKEGCLSFPGLYLSTLRYRYAIVNWLNEKGVFQRAIFTEIDAIIVQHEIDHLNGILFVDREIKK